MLNLKYQMLFWHVIIMSEIGLCLQVSWLKRYGDTSHLLTFGQSTYSNDARFQIYHEEASNDWRLQIQFPRMEDEGIYECLVSTDPPLTRRFRLFVIGKLPFDKTTLSRKVM